MFLWCVQSLGCVWLFATPWTTSLFCPWDFSRQEYWSGLPFSFSRVSSWSRDWTHVSCISCIAGGFFTCWAIGEATIFLCSSLIYDWSWTFRFFWNVCMGFCKHFCPFSKVSRAKVCHLLQPHFFLHIREGYLTSWVRLGVKVTLYMEPQPLFHFSLQPAWQQTTWFSFFLASSLKTKAVMIIRTADWVSVYILLSLDTGSKTKLGMGRRHLFQPHSKSHFSGQLSIADISILI